ncbi:hypothetical protein FACS1894211_02360 [Clostridia bacterium]|nr:hypothetical protein FACS1894211_02360 [Clostridia bacterium]
MIMASSGIAAQSLREHLLQTLPKDLPFLTEIRFLLAAHDIGKADERFQRKVTGEPVEYRHADGSYEYLSKELGDNVLNWLVRSHHNPDSVQFEFFKEQSVSIPKLFTDEIGIAALKDKLPINKVYTPAEILFLFSCLKYFDRSDRYYHINNSERPLLQIPLSLAKIEDFRNSLKKGARNKVYNDLWAAIGSFHWGNKKTCFIKSPTGSGKTLSALRLALKDKIKKLVYVAPFLSITSQVSNQLKNIFGESEVVDFTSLGQDDKCESLDNGFLEYSFTKPITIITAYKFVEGMFFSLPITYGYLNSTYRPDFVGTDKWGNYHVFESKGYSSGYRKATMIHAKQQVSRIAAINGKAPDTRVACVFDIRNNIKGYIEDPDGNERGINIEFNLDTVIKEYYSYFEPEWLEGAEKIDRNGHKFYVKNLFDNVFYGISVEVYNILREEEIKKGELIEAIDEIPKDESESYSIGLDGIIAFFSQ